MEKAENIFNFYLDFNWEFGFISLRQAPTFLMECRGSVNRCLFFCNSQVSALSYV